MATFPPDDNASPAEEQETALGELLVAYHQQLIDQSRLTSPGKAGEAASTSATEPANELATPVDDPEFYSAISESVDANPQLVAQLVQLEDCLWRLEAARRAGSPASGGPSGGGATTPNDAHGRIGRFEILRELGRGGLGIVFLAHDPVLNRNVAIKVPRGESLLAPELRKRFLREAQAAARLTHPNIVPVYEIGEAGPVSYIASAYIAGQSLAQWLREQLAPLPVEVACGIVAHLADAMHYAHSQGVLHRDLKPANVLLEAAPTELAASVDRKVPNGKITDFGLAKLLDRNVEETRSGAILGTPAYMSPEQADGQHDQLGPATDIYSLGVILYELLAGRPPYRGASDAATLVQVVQGTLTSLRQSRPEIASDLEAICLKCLEREPAARYVSAGELAADLRRYLRGESTLARPQSSWQRLVRWTKRNPILAALSFVSLALLLSVATVSTVAALRIRTARDEARQIAIAETAARLRANKALLSEQAALQEAQVSRVAADQQAANATQISNMLLELFNTADPLGMARLGFRDPDEVGMNLPLSELLSRGARHARQSLVDQPLAQATLLDTLGTVYSNLGQLAEAEPLIREAYELRQNNGAGEADLATSKLHLGNLLRSQGKYGDAEPLLREVLQTRTQLLSPRDLQVAEATFALAWLLYERTGFGVVWETSEKESLINQSGDLIQRTLDIQTEQLGPHHRDLGITLSAAAVAKFNRGDVEGAKQLLLEATNALLQQEGGERMLQAMTDVAKGTIARAQKDFETAIDCYRTSLATAKELLGAKHIMSMMLMGELAGTLGQAGQMAAAEECIREAIQVATEMFPNPAGHPAMIAAVHSLADIAESRGEYVESEILEEKASLCEAHWTGARSSREYPRVLALQLNSGRYDIFLRILDYNIFPHWYILHQKALLATANGQIPTAEKLLRYLLDHPQVCPQQGKDRHKIKLQLAAAVYANRPEDPEWSDLLEQSWNRNEPMPPTIAPGECYERLAMSRILIEQKRHKEVAEVVEATLTFLNTSTIPGNWCIGYAQCVAGQLRDAQERDEEAEALLLSGLANLRKTRGERHHLTREAAGALVELYQQHGRAAEAVPFEPLLKQPEPIEIQYELQVP